MAGDPGPMVRRRQLGAALRQLRLEAKLSINDVAKLLLCSTSKISRLESAKRNISLRDVRDLVGIYRVTDPGIREQLMRLAEESRETAWWSQFNLTPAYERLIGLEGSATSIIDYQIGAVPGLLQTREYAAALTGAWIADDPVALQEAVEVRMARQRLLEGTALHFVVDESAIHRSIGSREVRRNQVKKLIELSVESRIELQIIPFSAGAHKGLVTGFTVLQFANSKLSGPAAGMSDVVYLEGVVDAAYLDQPDDVETYVKAFAELQKQAFNKIDTLSFMEATLRGM